MRRGADPWRGRRARVPCRRIPVAVVGLFFLAGCAAALRSGDDEPPASAPLYGVGHNLAPDPGLAAEEAAWVEGIVQRALETRASGDRLTAARPEDGLTASVVPLRSFQAPTGVYCRTYDLVLSAGGRGADHGGVRCRDATGQWVEVEGK